MKGALSLLVYPFLFLQVAGVFLCLLLVVSVGGYFFARALLQIMGLHLPSPEQIHAEMKLLKISGAILISAIVCATLAGFLGSFGGITD